MYIFVVIIDSLVLTDLIFLALPLKLGGLTLGIIRGIRTKPVIVRGKHLMKLGLDKKGRPVGNPIKSTHK